MLKRLLWLAFFCAALFLLLGLMAQRSEALLTAPPQTLMQGALPPGTAPQKQETPENVSSQVALAEKADETPPKPDVFSNPVTALAGYRQARYQVFHLPDKAG